MQITLNGELRDVTGPMTVNDLLAELKLAGVPVVVELNKLALLPKELETASLNEGDVVEIIQITAGG